MTAGVRTAHRAERFAWRRLGFLVLLAWIAGMAIAAVLGAAADASRTGATGTSASGVEIAVPLGAAFGGQRTAGRRWIDDGGPLTAGRRWADDGLLLAGRRWGDDDHVVAGRRWVGATGGVARVRA